MMSGVSAAASKQAWNGIDCPAITTAQLFRSETTRSASSRCLLLQRVQPDPVRPVVARFPIAILHREGRKLLERLQNTI